MDSNGDVVCLDAELLQIQEVSPLPLKSNPCLAEKLFGQWISIPETVSVVIFLFLSYDLCYKL